METPRASGLVVAAGSSHRMGFDKITARFAGRPLLARSLAAFEDCAVIGPCALVCAEDRVAEFRTLAAPFKKFRAVVPGGAERSDSVLRGLAALEEFSPDLVAVHDAARPLVTPPLIAAVVDAAAQWGAAAAAAPVSDSIHRAGPGGRLEEPVPRARLWAMETPQVAGFADLRLAITSAKAAGQPLTDEVAALIACGIFPHPVPHPGLNFKITYPRDLTLAEAVLATTPR
jgi:2-C-methyl-D-erythritol 4-phosphate cytidylyltransferase